MSERFRLVLLLVVLLYLFVAIKLIHRKRLSLNYSLLWLLMAVVLVVMVVFPNLVYNLTWLLGIDLPIHMIFTGFSFFALVMLFYLTCIVSRDNEKNRTMVQQMALMERRIRELEERLAEMESTGAGKKTPAAAEKESA